jgi:hypothetical protein
VPSTAAGTRKANPPLCRIKKAHPKEQSTQPEGCLNRMKRHGQTSKSKISDLIKKDSAFIKEKKSVRMDSGRNANNTSAWVLDARQLSMYDDLYQAVLWSI